MALIIISVGAGSEPAPTMTIPPPFEKEGQLLVAYPHFKSPLIPLNPPFLKGEISHNDLDGTTIKAAKIHETAGLEIKDTLRKCQQENEGCQKLYLLSRQQ